MAHDDDADLRRRFDAAISGTELDDLRELAGDLLQVAGGLPAVSRPELRRPPSAQLATYRLRVDLDHAHPPIWRRLDLRSDLTLDVVHQVLQAAFGWTDSHLHRFALGGGPFDLRSQLFLCPYDVEEGEDDGTPATDVRLDETLQEPGDVLRYVYDYGDSWELTIRLEEVLAVEDSTPSAVCVDGRRAAPPEDCGGITDAEQLAEVLEDPAHFDLEEVNGALRNPVLGLREYGVHPRLVELVNRLRFSPVGEDLVARVVSLTFRADEPTTDEKAASLRAHQWFLDRAQGAGIELTSAGYLKPADVQAAANVVPAMGDWIGKANRESHSAPLLDFRQSLQTMGLLRKQKGRLVLTRAGAAAGRNPDALWEHLAQRLVPKSDGSFVEHASLLLLAYAASSPGTEVPLKVVAEALSHLGWRTQRGPVEYHHLYRLPVYDVLRNINDRPVDRRGRNVVHPAAAALARAALRTGRADGA